MNHPALRGGLSESDSRARMGRDPCLQSLDRSLMSFYTHARVGRDVVRGCWLRRSGRFYPTRATSSLPTGVSWPCMFLSTRPGRARRVLNIPFDRWNMFLSTRPRGARHALDIISDVHPSVSIHAPAWGATIVSIADSASLLVSIHAPAWGATQ